MQSLIHSYREGSSRKPFLFRVRSSESFILAVVSLAWFTDMFLYGIIVPVIPTALTDRLGIPENDQQYWTSVLLAVFGVSQLFCALLFGYLSDKMSSRKSFMYIGLIALGLSTILLCVGRTIGMFIAGRVLQGASAAMVGSVGLAIVVDTVPMNQIGRAMGVISIFTGLAVVLAPVLGGVAYAKSGYYTVFAISFSFVGMDLVLRLLMIERRDALKWEEHSTEPPATELQSHLPPLEQGSEDPTAERLRDEERPTLQDMRASPDNVESTPRVVISSHVDVQQLPTIEPHGNINSTPKGTSIPGLELIKSPIFLSALWGICVLAALMTAFDSTLVIYTREIFGFNTLGGGSILFALLAPSLASPIAGDLADKYGRKWLATGGFVITIPFLILLRLVDHHSLSQIVVLCVLLFVVGLAIALSMAPLMSEIAHCGIAYDIVSLQSGSTRPNAFAQAFGLASCAFAAGTVIGPVWGGLILAHSGWGTMTWTLSLLCIAAAISSAFFISSEIDEPEG